MKPRTGYRLEAVLHTGLDYIAYGPQYLGLNNNDLRRHAPQIEHSKINICKHEFRLYIGIVETFNYCIHCDAKESIR